jgi:hypothetical protein
MLQNNSQNSHKPFGCDVCDYKCSRKNDLTKHFSSQKHLCNMSSNNCNQKLAPADLHCILCHKKYKSRVGLWRHKKICDTPAAAIPETDQENTSDDKQLIHLLIKENTDFKNIIMDLVKNNGDLQKQMFDVCKTSGGGGATNSYNNNKTFNMQVFLNEQCKDAMNIMDFVNSMTLELSDLEDVGEVGYVEGISKIIIRKLNELDVCKRPIHCSDFKREIMYVKDMDVWSKENNTFDKIRKAIKYVTKKNSDLLIPWIQKYPSGMNIEHPHNDIYMRLMNQAMGGRESFIESENKIIKKISKAVCIDKMHLY